LLPDDSGYFTCKQNTKLLTNKFKSGGLREKLVVATWEFGTHLISTSFLQLNKLAGRALSV